MRATKSTAPRSAQSQLPTLHAGPGPREHAGPKSTQNTGFSAIAPETLAVLGTAAEPSCNPHPPLVQGSLHSPEG
jgi:hypothetical protein